MFSSITDGNSHALSSKRKSFQNFRNQNFKRDFRKVYIASTFSENRNVVACMENFHFQDSNL